MPWIIDKNELRRIRESLHLDRTKAATLVGVTRWSVYRHETPGLAPTSLQPDTADRYSEAYGVPITRFASWTATTGRDEEPPRDATGDAPPLLDMAAQRRCAAAYRLFAGSRFIVRGRIRKYADVPDAAARTLGCEPGACVRLDVGGVTVLSPKAEHSRALIDATDTRTPVALVVELRVAPPGLDGFPFFGKTDKIRPFAFVIESVEVAHKGEDLRA